MKITRTPARKLAPLPLTLATTVEHLVNDDQDQIKIWANMKEWNFPRSDLFQFITVLNRFDAILEATCQEYELKDKQIQKKPFTDETKLTLLAMMHLTKLLFENCTNRNLYNSYEHLNNLLNTTDIDILESVLRLMLRPAQRVNNPKAVQSSFLVPQDKITELARGGSIADLTSTSIHLSKEVTMSFYRTGEGEEEEGLQTISILADQLRTDQEMFWYIVKEYRIPVDYHFELLNRIRIANHLYEDDVKKQLLIVKFVSIVIMAHTMSETIAQNRVFIYEPHLVAQIAQLVSYDNSVSIDIQTYALYALDGIARHRSKVTEVLNAFNASANHGILMHILRQLSGETSGYTIEFLDALFTLLSFLFQTQAGGQMLMSAGIMSTLIQIMNNTNDQSALHIKALIKVIGLLDTIMNNVNTSFSSFCNAHGIDSLLKVIKTQVDLCVERGEIENYDSLTLVKNSLRFLIRMMESSDTAEGLRNLIESSIPHTLKKVMEHHRLFGPSVFSLVVNVATTFIHNEPTSLSVLQELKLPQTFLTTFIEYDQPNCEVLMAAVHAFGAICLNSAGLDMFTQAKPLPHFFELMTSPSFVSNPAEVGGVTQLGTTMDELIRHHPKLKGEVFVCANQLLLKVIEVGNSEEGKPMDNSHQLLYEYQAKDYTNERADCLLLGHVDLVARFLEGFLRNTDNIKEFINYGGPELLLSYYSLPMLPYNFSVSNAFDSLSFVFRVISDVSPLTFAKHIIDKVYESSKFVFSGDLEHGKSTVYDYINVDGSDKELLAKGNDLFRKCSVLFGYIGLLSTAFASAILTNTKNAIKLVEWAVEPNEKWGNLFELLGKIHRTMVWQNILLRDSVPKPWYITNTNLKKTEEEVDLKDPRVINVRRFKLLLSEIPPALMPVLQGMIKVSVSRRSTSSASSHELSLYQRSKKVAQNIAKVFKDNLLYMRDDSPVCKYDYYASMFSMISMLLLDDRSRTALETPIAIAFEEIGIIDLISKTLLDQFWKAAEDEVEAGRTAEDGSDLQRINTSIELLLAIVHHLGSPKLFHNSPHTTIVTIPDPNDEYGSVKLLDGVLWMATMQLKFTDLFKYIYTPSLKNFSRHVLHSLLRCLTQNMKVDQRPSNLARRSAPLPQPTPTNNNNNNNLTRFALLESGFEPSLVTSALTLFNGNYLSALDYLFSRRLVEHPVNDGPPRLHLPQFRSGSALSPQEFDAGIRILVNMWYDQTLATQALTETGNLHEASVLLARSEPSAIRTPAISGTTVPVTTAPAAPAVTPATAATEGTVEENEDDDDDDQYVDMDTDEEEEEEEEEISDEDEDDTDVKAPGLTRAETLAQLEERRDTFRIEVPPVLGELVNERADIDFEIRDLMVAFCCGDPAKCDENSAKVIPGLIKPSGDKEEPTDSVNKIRICALMLREPAMQDSVGFLIEAMSQAMDWSKLMKLIAHGYEIPDANQYLNRNSWVNTLFLVLEMGLAQQDEPDSNVLSPRNGMIPIQVENEKKKPLSPFASIEFRTELLNDCLRLLWKDNLPKDTLISTLRIIVRLTKHHELAVELVAKGGLHALFRRPQRSFEVIKIQQAYIIMILRHIIEDESVLKNCMKEWFSFWFTVPSTRSLDISTFLRNNSNMVLRNPKVFLDVSTEVCRFLNANDFDFDRIRYIGPQEVVETPTKPVSENQNTFLVVYFLLSQLVQTQAEEEDFNLKIGYTGFILQCLLELVSSYPSCKHDIIVFNENQMTPDPTLSNHARIRQSILFTLVNKLLPYNAINPATDAERKRQAISMWVASLLVAMCYDTNHVNNNNNNSKNVSTNEDTLAEIRKHVLDVVYRSFKDALQSGSTTSTSAKYIRYFALSELCHRILNARPTSINPGSANANQASKEDTVIVVAKLMLEKKFVPVLISVISDVDVNYPHAKMILNSILRPLEQLTKLAIHIDRTKPRGDEEEKKEDDKKEDEEESHHDVYLPMDTDGENEAAEEEVSNLYRNSSLAMYDGTALEEETSEESSEEEDIEMASSGDEMIDDDEEDDHSNTDGYETVDSSDDNEGEEVEVEEEDEEEDVGEDEEMDELIRSHRFHHSDTEDEDDETSDDGHDSDTSSESASSFTSSSYDSSNESLNSDRSDSIHSENSREMSWHLEDINDDNGLMPRNEDRHHRFNGGRQVIHAEFMSEDDDDEDDDDMDVDQSGLDEDQDSDDLDQEEIDDVERNLELLARSGSALADNIHMRNNGHGVGSGAGRIVDRENIILHPLLRGAGNSTAFTSIDGSHNFETQILSATNGNHLQAYEDIIGGSAVRILENLITQQEQRNNPTQATADSSTSAAAADAAVEDGSQESKDTLKLLQEFQPMQTADRWTQEVQMVYISSVASEKAEQLSVALINKLDEVDGKESGAAKKALKVDAADPSPAEEIAPDTVEEEEVEDEDEFMDVEEDDAEGIISDGEAEVILEINDDEPDEQQERVIVTVNGEEVDITGTGIDAEFLEALPDDLRAEVLSQQMAEHRSSLIQTTEEDTISPEFLAALPPDIREEVIHQESIERNRRQARQSSAEPENTNRDTPVVAIPSEEDNRQARVDPGSPGRFVFDSGRINAALRGQLRTIRTSDTPFPGTSSFANASSSRKAMLHRDAIRIVDKVQLATLARLLFVPQSISKALLNRLLLNLCENSKTRGDLLSLLICILQDGSSDLAAVDRSFNQLSIHTGKHHQNTDETDKMIVENVDNTKLNETAPNLITQRCLEILYYVVTWNDRSLAYFLTENDSFGHLKRRHSVGRKSKSKASANNTLKYPILILIGLLDRPAFSSNTTLMGQIMNLLTTLCRPFPSLVKKYNEKLENKKSSDSTENEKQHHHTPKPPAIPDQYLYKIVDVLSIGDCSSYTFQYTLSVLSYLSSLEGALDTIINALIATANTCGKQILIDLEQLLSILKKCGPGLQLQSSDLAQFSAATSHQTKLLRVLKAMDYLYTRKRNNTKSEENEKLVLEIYNRLEFLPLWKMLGSCLSVIQNREDLINVATVLLPLVESFMAVSKYSTNKGYTSTETKSNDTEDLFFAFTEEHKKILNIMVRNNPSLMGGSFSLLVHNPKILEFDNKRSYFVQQLHKRTEPREHYPPLQLNVRRAHVFEDTYRQLQGRTGKEIKHGKLNVQFHNEEGVDAGGVAREWFSVLARQMFDPNYALFITSAADKLTYQPNRASGVNSDHLSYFKCVGRIIGKAIHDGRLLDAYFTRSFYKLMLGRSVDYRDVEAVDPAYYKSLVWMLDNDITDIIDLTFSVETDDFGTNKIIDLKPDGRNIAVTESNKHEYVTLITEQKLVLAIKDQVNAFLEGFHDIIPAQLIQIFNEQELELLISGLPDIDIDEWKANTVYEGYTLSSPQIQWFWRAVRSFDQEERAKLLQFSTGTSKVPLEGFSQLQGSNGVQKFQIHKEFGDVNRLPSAHTCFNQIDLPQYLSYEDLRSNLFKAISECSTGFAFQ